MRFSLPMALLCLLAFLGAAAPSVAATIYVADWIDGQTGTGTAADPYRNLQDAIDNAASGDTIYLFKGDHGAFPGPYIDPTCGNCNDAEFRQDVWTTVGFRIANKSLILKGESRLETTLWTGAAYGILFENAGTSRVENLRVSGGVRDEDGDATMAAIVARWTNLTVRNVSLVDNNGYPESGDGDPGVGGIAVREGAVLTAEDILIMDSSWDGITFYRGDPDIPGSGARGTVKDVSVTRGRGVGIAAVWDAQADITNARVSRYWKGVGSFGNARVTLRNSIVRDQLFWGVQAYGSSNMTATNNLVLNSGLCGLAQFEPTATVSFINNIVSGNGWGTHQPACKLTGLWLTELTRAQVTNNLFYNNNPYDACYGFKCDPYTIIKRNGNIGGDPLFVDSNFSLSCDSPALNAGRIDILDKDGTRSDIGPNGGPESPRMPPTCGMADLQPMPITFTAASYEAGDVIRFDTGVRNAGRDDTGVFAIKWLIDGALGGEGRHSGVPRNTEVMNDNSQFTWTATEGTHKITFAVDSRNAIPESIEGNNTTSISLVVGPTRADLTPTTITYNPVDLVAGRQVYFDSGVHNLKNVPTGDFRIKWYVGNVQVGYGVHYGVPGGGLIMNGNSQYTWTAVSGIHTLKFVLDTDGNVNESNEGNNTVSVTVRVP